MKTLLLAILSASNLAVYLASEKSSYIHGQALSIDGGWSAT